MNLPQVRWLWVALGCLGGCFTDSTPVADDGSTSEIGATTTGTSSAGTLGAATTQGSGSVLGSGAEASSNGMSAETSEVTDASDASSSSSSSMTSESGTEEGSTSVDGSSSESTGGSGETTSEEGDTTGGAVQCPACASGFCDGEGDCARGIFVSSVQYSGNFGGLTGADLYCESLARAAGLRGDWMAWLSDSRLDAGGRIPGSSDPYVLVDGTRVAANFDVFRTHDYDNLDAIYLEHGIELDEYGQAPVRGTACSEFPAVLPVWTSTITTGWWDSEAVCDDWTSTEPLEDGDAVYLGDARSVDSFWTAFACNEASCSRTASLYCMQTGI